MSRPLNLVQVSRIVERATLAPSIHNTQPWRFEWAGQCLAIHVDPTRQLHVTDPQGRQMHVSVGAAIELATLAMRAEGYQVKVAMLPEPTDPTLAATLTPEREQAVDAATRKLVQAIPRRITQRDAFDPRPVPRGVVNFLRNIPQPAGCWISTLEADKRPELAAALDRAEARLLRDPDYLAELAAWRRPGREPVDGLPDAVLPHSRDAVSAIPIRRLDPEHAEPRRTDTPRVDDPVLLVVGSDFDDRAAWLDVGRVTGRLLLTATTLGLAASPVTQSLDHLLDRQQLRHQLGFVGYPQMLLRFGYGKAAAATPRRPVTDVLAFAK